MGFGVRLLLFGVPPFFPLGCLSCVSGRCLCSRVVCWSSRPGALALPFLLESAVFSSFVAALPVSGPVSVLAPVAVPPSFSGFVPSSLRVGSRVVSSSRFLPVVSGVVSSLSWDSRRGAVVAVVGGVSLACLASGLGGAGSSDAVALVAALREARRSGVAVSVWGAPGSSGRVCPGYFCGVTAAE